MPQTKYKAKSPASILTHIKDTDTMRKKMFLSKDKGKSEEVPFRRKYEVQASQGKLAKCENQFKQQKGQR